MQFEIACVDNDAVPFFQQIFHHRFDAEHAFAGDAMSHTGKSRPGHLLRLCKGRVVMEANRWSGKMLENPRDSLGHRALVPASKVILGDGTLLMPIVRVPILLAASWQPIDHTQVAAFSLIVSNGADDGELYPVLIPPDQCFDWLDASRDVRSLQRPLRPQWESRFRLAA